MLNAEEAVLITIGYLGSVRGTTRLHKLVFLLTQESGVGFDVEFIRYTL